MAKFSEISKFNLATCHNDIQRVLYKVIEDFDFSVLCGYRGKAAQREAFLSGRSKVDWPDSRHNATPSLAVDIAPWPIDWSNEDRFIYLAGFVMSNAKSMGVDLVWGGDWSGNMMINSGFRDLGHFELRINDSDEWEFD